jgi:hypothetical protein
MLFDSRGFFSKNERIVYHIGLKWGNKMTSVQASPWSINYSGTGLEVFKQIAAELGELGEGFC